jgi:8-hydroxy-5-deazaflavin:NADPH oxidoreductase
MPLLHRSLFTAAARSASSPGLRPMSAAAMEPTRVGVIGAGSLAGTVGRLWVEAGHEVMFSSRHPEELAAMARQLGPRASSGTVRQAAEFGPVVLIAVPYSAMPQLAKELADVLRGKAVLDACNDSPFRDDPVGREALANGLGPTSARYLPGARLVRAFSAVDATAIAASARRRNGKLAVPLAGDDAEAVRLAEVLVREAGCEPLRVGNLAAARRFERGSQAFRANTGLPELRRLLGLAEGG